MNCELVTSTSIPVLEMGHVRDLDVPAGLTILEMINCAFPDLPANQFDEVRALMATRCDVAVVHPDFWKVTRPKPHVQVVLRLIPKGDDGLRSVLSVVITVAGMALGQFWAGAIVPTAGLAQNLVGGLLTAGLTIAGNMLLNSLIPIQGPANEDVPQTYSIQGWKNTMRPNEPVPFALGRMRMAPPFAAPPYTTIVGDDQFVTALLTFGYGPLDVSDLRIGDTPIGEFSDVELQLREGRANDQPVSIYPRQVLESREGVELTRPEEDDVWIDVPIVRQGANNATEAAMIFAFPAGLFSVDKEGETYTTSVEVRIRQRLAGSSTWGEVITLKFRAKKRQAFFRQYRWLLPSRGKWEFEVLKLTNDDGDTNHSRQINLTAIQSFRPEHPLNFDKALSLLGIRIRATNQLNGALDSVNAIVHRTAPDWDGSNWVEGTSRSPATAYRAALQGSQNPWPVADSEIDLEQLEEWYDFCAAKGLKYDHIHEEAQSFGEMLLAICGAGRATPRHDGARWGVVIDRPGDPVIDHISPRNSREFHWRRSYFKPPHAFRIRFRDETNDWAWAERIVPWPDHDGDITLTEDLPLSGKTDPDEVWIEARRRQHELTYRLDSFSAVQDGGARVATRGDTIMAAYDTLERTQTAARILSVDGQLIQLDEPVLMEAGKDYALRYRAYTDADDADGMSVVVALITRPGSTEVVLTKDEIDPPRVGEIAHFGLLGQESMSLKVRGVEAGDAFSQVVHMVAAAPEIDALTDAEVPPSWTGYVGEEINLVGVIPMVPVIMTVQQTANKIHLKNQTLIRDYDLEIGVAPGNASTDAPAEFEFEYRLLGEGSWISEIIPAASAGIDLGTYDTGTDLELRVRAISPDGTPSDYSVTKAVNIGSALALPTSIDNGAVTLSSGLGHVRIAVPVSDPETSAIQLYRVPVGGTLDPALHAIGELMPAVAGNTYTLIDGDSTRSNLVVSSSFEDPIDWVAGAGWNIASDTASHTAGTAGRLGQSTGPLSGVQRITFVASGVTAGSATLVLSGPDQLTGLVATVDGTYSQSLDADTASSDPTGVGIDASSDFDGSITHVYRYLETSACAPAGEFDYYLAPHNVANVPGPLSGPFLGRVL